MRYRTAAIFAGFGLAVALVAGLAGAVPFATVLVRAVTGAAIFGALGLGTVTVLERFVPELFARRRAEEPAPAPAPTIDIVLPEENPLASEFADELEAADESGEEAMETVGPGGPEREAAGELPASDVEALGPTTAEPAADVDALPSLDGLDAGPEASAVARSAAARSTATGAADTHTDPSLAARALRTWLKRDHEG